MSGEYMKKKPLDITFHNPNSPEDSETIAKDFISRAAQEVVKKEILKNEDSEDVAFQSSLTMDEIEENFKGLAQESSFAILRGIEAIFPSQVRNYTRNKLNWLKEDYLLYFRHFLIHKITPS